jgi:hypothetical protein
MPTRKTGAGRKAEPTGPIHTPHAVSAGSELDAMGKDKRRQVVGHSYGPSRRQQLAFFGIVGMLVLLIYFGARFMVAEFDQSPTSNPDVAPWSKADAPQTPPARPF